jgi:hypothetical protein
MAAEIRCNRSGITVASYDSRGIRRRVGEHNPLNNLPRAESDESNARNEHVNAAMDRERERSQPIVWRNHRKVTGMGDSVLAICLREVHGPSRTVGVDLADEHGLRRDSDIGHVVQEGGRYLKESWLPRYAGSAKDHDPRDFSDAAVPAPEPEGNALVAVRAIAREFLK